MGIRTQQSLSGFIVTDPELTVTSTGDARFHTRIGQEHFQHNEDGSFTKLESTFHELVQYRKAAERSYARFQKGDSFIAEGYVHEYDRDVEGQTQRREEFVAKKIGHDAARQKYDVIRKAPATDDVDLPSSLAPSGVPDELPATATGAPVSARAATSHGSVGRRDQLADIIPDGTHGSGPKQSKGLAL